MVNKYNRYTSHMQDNLRNTDLGYCGLQRNKDVKYNQDNAVTAYIKGGPLAPEINGLVTFTEVSGGTEVTATMYGLPNFSPAVNGMNPIGPFGFHIHENGNCSVGDTNNPFMETGGHWNPDNQPHGNHAGDFPVLFSNNGFSYMTFFTNRFKPQDIIGKSIVIHQSPDDYRTQPSGNAGKRLACGVIEYYYNYG